MDISKKYQKLTSVEHILLRPDTYVGSMEETSLKTWIYQNSKMVQKEITYIPALYKIFDEILVNAADHHQRSDDCNRIHVDISSQQIAVFNNGDGIPIVKHTEHNVYIPELIFGHLLTGENFDDDKKRTVGGRNGYGAKLTNIFSTLFTIETDDGKKSYKQTWKKNMSVCEQPIIEKSSGKPFTKITFQPDFKRFKMENLSDDHIQLFHKRIVDIAGVYSESLNVKYNDEKISIQSFKDYISLYTNTENLIHQVVNKRWEIAVVKSTDEKFDQVSFVNGIATLKGGSHVNYVVDLICTYLIEKLKSKNKSGVEMKNVNLKNHFWLFINCKVENPTFDSQTKEYLTSKKFGKEKYNPELSKAFFTKISKSGIVESILAWANMKSLKTLKTVTNKTNISSIPKLNDANKAGKYSGCTLILTEGDSASSLALSGITVVGRDTYGVFPLKGKLLNVREAPNKQILENKEIQHLMKIIGLVVGKKYTSTESLRYDHIMFLTDQDLDGSHIKGLLINFFHHFWPELIELKGFLKEFITPIIKATKKNEIKSFFSLNDYEDWKKTVNISQWTIKYYKGLGTNSAVEAMDYFKNIKDHTIRFEYEGKESSDVIDMAFSKKRVADRKEWLRKYDPLIRQDFTAKKIKYTEFVNKELIQFSMADNVRSIPSMVDGLKPSQRKIIYSAFKRNLKNEIKVAQFAGYVSEHSAYHHGDDSLMGTIINMAQNYVGSNNYNLLYPSGAFGTRRLGGKDSASPRYIFTRLNDLTRSIFREEDDPLCVYLNDDGDTIEPIYYIPIIPFVLVNGSSGIGTGWSTDIPSYNIDDIIKWIENRFDNKETPPLIPFYKNFKGRVEKVGDNKYTIYGKCSIKDDYLIIRELPIGTWTSKYKTFLETEGYKTINEYHKENTVHFEIELDEDDQKLSQDDIIEKFKLSTPLSTNNMIAYNPQCELTRYASPEAILEEFYQFRLTYYQKRKDYWLAVYQKQYDELSEKARFFEYVSEKKIIIEGKTKDTLFQECLSLNFSEETIQKCLNLSLWSLTNEYCQKYKEEALQKKIQIDTLMKSDIKDLWKHDLDEFKNNYNN